MIRAWICLNPFVKEGGDWVWGPSHSKAGDARKGVARHCLLGEEKLKLKIKIKKAGRKNGRGNKRVKALYSRPTLSFSSSSHCHCALSLFLSPKRL